MAKVQVILTADVAGQGRKGDIVTVSDGYAHNFLIKGKKGVLATPEEMAKIEKARKKEAKRQEEEKQKAIELKTILENKTIVLKVKVGESGKLFGAITNKEISTAIKENFDLDIDRKKIEASIKSLGDSEAIIKLHTDVKATLKINVIEL